MKNKTLIYISALILITFFAYRRWLSFDITANSDWLYYFPQALKNFFYPSVWSNLAGLGLVNILLWRLPIDLLSGFFGILGYGYNVAEKFVFFWPTLILANISSYFLVKKITKSDLAGFIGAIVFNYNTYYLVLNSAFLLYSAAAWSIITLLVFMKALENKKIYWYILSGLTLFLTGSYDFRIAYITVFLLGFYFVFFSFYIEKFQKKIFIKNFSYFVSQGFVFVLLNFYWLIATLNAHSLTSNTVLSRGLFGNEFINVMNAFSLYHPFWTGKESAWFAVQPIMVYFWLIPVFAFSGFWLNRKNKNVLFFGLISMLGILLTKQVAYPFSGLYDFLFKVLPFFDAFREATKFYFLIALGYSVLIGSFISFIWGDLRKAKQSLYIKYFLTILIAFLFLWNIKPLITGEISGIYVPRHIPKDYIIAKNFVDSQKGYFRTFWVPVGSTWSDYTDIHPIADTSLFSTNWSTVFSKYLASNTTQAIGKTIIGMMNMSATNNLLDMSSIRYVFIPTEDKINEENSFIFYGNRKYYINQLDKIPWLKRINIGTKNLVVYENYGYRPHVYATQRQETINKEQPYKTVDYKFITPSQYEVQINNVKSPFYLNFSEAYNSGWKVYVGQFQWYRTLLSPGFMIQDSGFMMLPERDHFQNDATLNSYFLNPKSICKQSAICKQNPDGTYDLNLTLYFAPQSYLYLGLIVSGGTLVLVLGYLVIVLGRTVYEKNKK